MATIQLTTQDFKDKVFNYTKEQEWKYIGSLPAIVEFYAGWCAPCKMTEPILEELSTIYKGKLIIYKVDTEAEHELSSVFGIQSIPTLLFIPINGDPLMQQGALPRNAIQQLIDERLIKQEKQ